MSPDRLIMFMQRLIKGAPRKVFLILDNLNTQKAKVVHEWLEEHALPPHSPELNPSEYFNGDLKGEIQHYVSPKHVMHLKRTVLSASRRIQKSPGRVRACFKHRNIRYAA